MRQILRITTVLAILLAMALPSAAARAAGVSEWSESEIGGFNGSEGYTVFQPSLESICSNGTKAGAESLEHAVLPPSGMVIVQSSTVGPQPMEVYETPLGEPAVDAWFEEQCAAIDSGHEPQAPVMVGEATGKLNLKIDKDSVEYRVIGHGTVIDGDGVEHALDSLFKQVVTFPDEGPPIVTTQIDKVSIR